MASKVRYRKWTNGLYIYFTRNVPQGGEVFLSLDDEILQDLGPRIFQNEPSTTNWIQHFLTSVQETCATHGKLDISPLQLRWLTRNSDDSYICPYSVGLLGLMSLAAHYMKRDDEASESAYYVRLRELLQVVAGATGGRPKGLSLGPMAELWEQWNAWIESNGWLSTATAGSGSHKLINYPISQALLRQGDKARLEELFRRRVQTGDIRRNWDTDHIASWLMGNEEKVGAKVRRILQRPGSPRYDALIESIYEVYISIDWSQTRQKHGTGILQLARQGEQRKLTAGLYRYENPVQETVRYLVLPKKPRRAILSSNLSFSYRQKSYALQESNPGWYQPLPLDIEDPSQGWEFALEGDSGFSQLVLPAADIWSLVPDPANPEADTFGTWQRPQPGEHFMLLCKEQFLPELERLKNMQLLQWGECVEVPELKGDWIELHQCMITNLDWSGVFTEHQEILEALMPHVQLAISLSGGLHVPNSSGWLATQAPQLEVRGVNTRVQLKIWSFRSSRQSSEQTSVNRVLVSEQTIETNRPISLEITNPGIYLLEASNSKFNLQTRRHIELLDWIDLPMVKPIPLDERSLPDGTSMQGAKCLEVVRA